MLVLPSSRTVFRYRDFIRVLASQCVPSKHSLPLLTLTVLCVIHAASAQPTNASHTSHPVGIVLGHVRDASGHPVPNSTVSLLLSERKSANDPSFARSTSQLTQTDSQGAYRFSNIEPGDYVLSAQSTGSALAVTDPVTILPDGVKTFDLTLQPLSVKDANGTAQFFDEPQFTVAGVTQATTSGGHGSDTVLRTTEALAKATLSLDQQPSVNKQASEKSENSLRIALTHDPNNCELNWKLATSLLASGKSLEALPYLQQASRLKPADPDLHHLLAEVEEKLDNPLDAVRDYQRAAEISPSESNLLDWGSELLTHRALQPANEILAKANRLYPQSVPILIALGVSWYALEFYDRAAQCLVNASNLSPANPTPYIFLGRMQSIGTFPTQGVSEKLAQFAQLQPDNAWANYYYAVSLYKQSSDQRNKIDPAEIEALLKKALQIDPRLGAAYLKLGIFYTQRDDFAHAISSYQKAIEVSPEFDEAVEESHYRLSQIYRRTGDQNRAQQELQLHDQSVMKTKDRAARDRAQIQEFVISMRPASSAPPQP